MRVSKEDIQSETGFIYRILHVCVDYMFGNTVPYGEARFKGSMQDANTKLLAPSATAL